MSLSEVGAFKSKFEEYISDSNEAISFKLIKTEEDLNNDKACFQPAMSHQIFGDKEKIFGYKGLKIKIYYSSAWLSVFISIEFDHVINSKECDGVRADKVLPKLLKALPANFKENSDEFLISFKKEPSFKPYGRLLYRYNKQISNKERTFELYHCTMADNGFKEYHDRIQTFLLWFIDGACYIDAEDEAWEFYTIYEKYIQDGKEKYCFMGYSTIYNFYAYPANKRPRISQFLILPPFQRMGHGATLLEHMYIDLQGRTEVSDITVEDPSTSFQTMRDYIDSKNCMKLSCYSKDKIKLGFSKAMVAESKKSLKLCQKQARRVYEILRLKFTDLHKPEDFDNFKQTVVARLELPYKTKQQRTLKGNEDLQSKILPSAEEQTDIIEKLFEQTINEYVPVVKKLELF